MSTKEIEAKLTFLNNKYYLVFSLEKPVYLDLYSDETNQVKSLFIELMKELIKNDISLKYVEDTSILNEKNQLIRDVASEYVEQLNHDIKLLLEDENLKNIRQKGIYKNNS